MQLAIEATRQFGRCAKSAPMKKHFEKASVEVIGQHKNHFEPVPPRYSEFDFKAELSVRQFIALAHMHDFHAGLTGGRS